MPGKTSWGNSCTAFKGLTKSKVALPTLTAHEDATISGEINLNLLDLNFWSMVENFIKVLEPINDKIFKLEGNGNTFK